MGYAPASPGSLQLELSSHCNLACRMCPLTTGETLSSARPGPMDEAVWARALDAAPAAGEVVVSGFGEALTAVETLPRLRELDARGVLIGLTTNGTAINERNARELAALANLVHVNVSIDSPDPEIYRAIRGAAPGPALRGVASLLAAIGEPRKVTVSSVLMAENLAGLAAFPRVLAAAGVRKWILQGAIDYTARSRPEGMGRAVAPAEAIARIREAAAAAGVEVACTLPSRLDLELHDEAGARRRYFDAAPPGGRLTRQCGLPWESPYIDKDGRVFPCCFAATDRGAVLGDLRHEALPAIWQGARYEAFRRALLEGGDALPPPCRRCNVVALGEHPLNRVAAVFVPELSRLDGPLEVVAAMRNAGSSAWTPGTGLRIGTARPRDRASPLRHDAWIAPDRAAALTQSRVEPGEVGTFRFPVAAGETTRPESFQLVAEGLAWLPGTRFDVPPKARAVEGGYAATLAEGIDFAGRPGYPSFLRSVRGISHDEPGGRWTDGPEAVLEFARPLPARFVLRLETQCAFDPLAGRPLAVRIGGWQGSVVVGWQPEAHELSVDTRTPATTIVLQPMGPVSPREAGLGTDTRQLGIRLRRLAILAAPGPFAFWRRLSG
jgi:radical SAM protein with 4Fe4S-binding SPASM domain